MEIEAMNGESIVKN